MARRWRMAGRAAALGVLALFASACLKLDMDLEVSSDDTVSGTIIFAVQKSLLELTGGSIQDVLGEAPLPEDVEGVTTEEYEDDEFAGQRYIFDSVPLEEMQQGSDQLQIVRDGDVFRVSGLLDLSSGATGPSGLSGFDPEQFLQGAELRIRITFPGEVTETNGEADGNTVTWQPEIGERLELRATASAVDSGGSSSLTLLLIIGAAVVVAAIVILIVLSQRRNRPAAATAGAGIGGGPYPSTGPAPPPATTEPLPPPSTGPAPPAPPPPPPDPP